MNSDAVERAARDVDLYISNLYSIDRTLSGLVWPIWIGVMLLAVLAVCSVWRLSIAVAANRRAMELHADRDGDSLRGGAARGGASDLTVRGKR